ncbi:uncharacterized protein si:ch211-286b5.2 isoform X2 [Puntigrus tetrazona]|uniref:uncharacterized protein si:ch211-286b5.2 isoform X2 n=1 Tax=Puntigrus tetrazona TaxID=1606681 RepID=UPI001C89D217|nr:uncharacterized protein si:ch211-286b5.2 isoform X2 [Puntigrus tetrazona]
MGKRKSTEFKAPKRTQPRGKRQKSTNQSEDDNQTLTPESENSHNALCSGKLDEHEPGQSTSQVTQTTEFPVDPCSLEEKTSLGDNDELGNPPEASRGVEQTSAITLQTPELENTPSTPLNTNAINVDQLGLDAEESEIPGDGGSELPSDEHRTERASSREENTATEAQVEEQLGPSDMVEEIGAEDTDPLVKRKIRKRMGMCRFGERKKMLVEQATTGKVFEGWRENETGQVTNEDQDENGVVDSEVPVPSISTSCTMQGAPLQEEQEQSDVQCGNELRIPDKCMVKEPVTHKTDHTASYRPDADDLNPPEQYDTACMEHNAAESNIREDSHEVTTEIGAVDFAEVCKELLAAQAEVVVASASALELAKPCGGDLVAGGDEADVSASERCLELTDITETIATENKCEASHFTQGAEKNSVSLPAAPPGGHHEDVHTLVRSARCICPSSPFLMCSVWRTSPSQKPPGIWRTPQSSYAT